VAAAPCCASSRPVMPTKVPALTAAAVVRARLAGWGRRRLRAGADGSAGGGAGGVAGRASMQEMVGPEPGRTLRAVAAAAPTSVTCPGTGPHPPRSPEWSPDGAPA
jgi:hypothetical protein